MTASVKPHARIRSLTPGIRDTRTPQLAYVAGDGGRELSVIRCAWGIGGFLARTWRGPPPSVPIPILGGIPPLLTPPPPPLGGLTLSVVTKIVTSRCSKYLISGIVTKMGMSNPVRDRDTGETGGERRGNGACAHLGSCLWFVWCVLVTLRYRPVTIFATSHSSATNCLTFRQLLIFFTGCSVLTL